METRPIKQTLLKIIKSFAINNIVCYYNPDEGKIIEK